MKPYAARCKCTLLLVSIANLVPLPVLYPRQREAPRKSCRAAHSRLLNPAFGNAGAISETEVVAQFLTLLAGGLGVAYGLDRCPCTHMHCFTYTCNKGAATCAC